MLSESTSLDGTHTATTSYTYNSFGEVLTVTDPLGHVTTNVYGGNRNLTSVTSPAPNGSTAASVTRFAYDSKGELTSITDPLNHVTTMTYTTAGLIATITDAESNVTSYQYDAHLHPSLKELGWSDPKLGTERRETTPSADSATRTCERNAFRMT